MTDRRERSNSLLDPTTLRANAAFVIGATTLLATVGWLVDTERLPWIAPGDRPIEETLSRSGRRSFPTYMSTARLIAVFLPASALLVWRREPRIRRVLGLYVGVLLIQIPTEAVFMRAFFPNMSVLIGLLHTAFRVTQLRRFCQYLNADARTETIGHRSTGLLLRAGSLFWSANLVFLSYLFATRLWRPIATDTTSRGVNCPSGREPRA